MKRNKCILAYGLTEEEINGLKPLARVSIVKDDMANLKICNILVGKFAGEKHEGEMPKEKLVIFNDFPDNEVHGMLKRLREEIPGVILAMTTPMSKMWSFKYLLNHLMEEREMYKKED